MSATRPANTCDIESKNEIIMQQALPLYIPPYSKAALLALFNAWHPEKKWNHCIEETNAKSMAALEEPFSLNEYWETLLDSGKLNPTSHNTELMKALFTVLIQSLFIQFNSESDTTFCITRLWFALDFRSIFVDWKKIPTLRFSARIKDNWWEYYYLVKYNTFTNGLFYGLGLTVPHFIKTYFRPQHLAVSGTLLQCPRDVWLEICKHLTNNDLVTFRKLARITFNIVENSALRLRHRLFLISQSAALTILTGHPIYSDQHHLISVGVAGDYDSTYRITQLTSPFTTKSFTSTHAANHIIMGANLFQAESDKWTLLMAYTSFPTDFIIQQRIFSSLAEEATIKSYRLITVRHERRDNPPAPLEERRSFWKKHSLFSIRGNHVTVNAFFEERDRNRKNTGKVEHHIAEFDLSDKDIEVQAIKRC